MSLAQALDEAQVAASESPHFVLPFLNGRGTPTGIDVRKVVQTGTTPFVTTGIAHKAAGAWAQSAIYCL